MLSKPLQFWDRPAEQLPGYIELLDYRPTAPAPPEPQPVAEVLDMGVVGDTMNEERENEMRGPPPLVPAPHLQQNAADLEMDRVFTSPSARTLQFERAMFQEPPRGDVTVLGARGSQATMTIEIPGMSSTLNPNAREFPMPSEVASQVPPRVPDLPRVGRSGYDDRTRRKKKEGLRATDERYSTRGNSAGPTPTSSLNEYFHPAGFGVGSSHKRSSQGRSHRRGSESSDGSAAPPRDGKKKKLTDKGIRVKSVPAVTGNWSGAEDISDEEIDEALARADESMEAEKASLRLQAVTTRTEQEPMEIAGDDMALGATQEVYTVESDDEAELLPPDVVFDSP